MKSLSDLEQEKILHEKRMKKIVPPKSPKLSKLKTNFFVKKLKFKKTQPVTSSDITSVAKIVAHDIASTSSSTSLPSNLKITDEQRQTPEGDDNNLILTKSASETNLQGTSTNSENLSKDNDQKISFDRTKSLENLKNMPAYGDLILDPSTVMSNANQTVNRPKDHLYKILVIGDLGTGKTSIIKRYVHRFFTQHYRATIGVDFALKALTWDDNTLIRLQLWDIAGQERYGNMTRVYYKEAVGAFIVFDVTRRNTFESVINWKTDLDSKVQLPDGSSIPCVLLANKCDQQKDYIVSNSAKMDEYCELNGFTAWYETSARDNINIDEAANTLVKKILSYDCLRNNDTKKQDDHITLNADSTAKKSCSC